MPEFAGWAPDGRVITGSVTLAARRKKAANPVSGAALSAIRRAENLVTDVPVVGVPNPYGVGAQAFEPETEIFDPGVDNPLLKGWDDAFNAVQASRRKERQDTFNSSMAAADNAASQVTGSAVAVIKAAKGLVGRPYIWGGTTARGVDCSGLLFYAFNQAGIPMKRFRAVDYGRMGTQVSQAEARMGDVVYWDNPGDVDHVGIYIGNGQVLQAPQSGDVVKVSKVWGNPTYRRILKDQSFGQQATPGGAPATSYNGRALDPHSIGVQSTVNLGGR